MLNDYIYICQLPIHTRDIIEMRMRYNLTVDGYDNSDIDYMVSIAMDSKITDIEPSLLVDIELY